MSVNKKPQKKTSLTVQTVHFNLFVLIQFPMRVIHVHKANKSCYLDTFVHQLSWHTLHINWMHEWKAWNVQKTNFLLKYSLLIVCFDEVHNYGYATDYKKGIFQRQICIPNISRFSLMHPIYVKSMSRKLTNESIRVTTFFYRMDMNDVHRKLYQNKQINTYGQSGLSMMLGN